MKAASLQLQPYMLAQQDDAQRFQSLGTLVSIKANSEQTGGAFNLFDVLCPLEYKTPLHIHYAEDVALYVLEGALEIYWGDEKTSAEAGAFFFQPRGTPHGFRVIGTARARILYMTFPAGFDEFVIERRQPCNRIKSADAEARYKIEVLGALPE